MIVVAHRDHSDIRILVQCTELSFKIGKLEPLFCSLCLFDMKERKPISENYHFHFNDDFTLSLIGQSVVLRCCIQLSSQEQTSSGQCTQAIFHLDRRSPNYCLLLKVERVLQGDVDNSLDLYNKYQVGALSVSLTSQMKPKDLNKLNGTQK